MNKKAFEIEKKRQRLAAEKNLENLRELYKSNSPEIKDLNTSNFWDERYELDTRLENQDGMTKDRIKTVAGFIPKGKIKILDVGAGLGWIEEIISSDKEKEIYGNDFSKKSVNVLRKSFPGDYSVQSIYNLKYKKNFFDVILLLEVLEHIPPSKTFKILNSIHNLLKKNGIFIISVPMNEGLEEMKDNPNGHVRMYTEELIKAELRIAGFNTIEEETFFAFSNFYNAKKIISKLTGGKNPNNIVVEAMKI